MICHNNCGGTVASFTEDPSGEVGVWKEGVCQLCKQVVTASDTHDRKIIHEWPNGRLVVADYRPDGDIEIFHEEKYKQLDWERDPEVGIEFNDGEWKIIRDYLERNPCTAKPHITILFDRLIAIRQALLNYNVPLLLRLTLEFDTLVRLLPDKK